MADEFMDMIATDDTEPDPPEREITFPEDNVPIEVKCRHDSDLHKTLITMLREMIIDGERHMEQREEGWEMVDEHMRLYVDLRRGQRKGDHTFDDEKKENPFKRDQYAVSSTYVNTMTRTDHITAMLTQADPFIHLEPREGGDFKGARIHEAALRYDAEQSRNLLQCWQMAFDSSRYQVAAWLLTWEEERADVLDEALLTEMGQNLETLKILAKTDPAAAASFRKAATRKKVVKQWNNWRAIDPRSLLPDPAFSITNQQAGRGCGFREYVNWLDLDARRKERGEGQYFNVERARKTSLPDSRNDEMRNALHGSYDEQSGSNDKYPLLEKSELFVKLIPYDFGLTPSEKQEIWWFTVVNREVIVRAHKLPFSHGKYPLFIGEAEPDQHSVFTPSVAEQNIGFQNLATWMVTSHIASTKRFTNDMLIGNDNLVNLHDFLNPAPGKFIRLTANGKRLHERGMMAIDQMYSQPKIQDVTGSHMEMAMRIMAMSQETMATPPPVIGTPMATKRTLGEIENVQAQASLRLGAAAQMLDTQIIGPVARCAVSNLQEFVSMERTLRLSGRLVQQMMSLDDLGQPIDPRNPMMHISPLDFIGEYDYIPRTPTMAKDPTRSAAMWGTLLQMLLQLGQNMPPDPEGKVINPMQVFNEWLRAQGITYMDNFRMPAPQPPPPPTDVTMLPDEEMQKQVQAGNVVPADQMGAM